MVITAAGLLVLLAQVPAVATHCTTWSTSTTDLDRGMIIIELPTPGDRLRYVYYDECFLPDCLFSAGLYAESNGIDGLQRGDEWVDDTCHFMIPADTWGG